MVFYFKMARLPGNFYLKADLAPTETLNIMYNIGRYLTIFLITFQAYAYEFQNFTLNQQVRPIQQTRGLHGLRKSSVIPGTSIIKDLTEYMQANYEEIGNEQFQKLLENHDLGGGVLNFSGFTWYKPMVNYDIKANRELAPHLESDQWIVQDTLTIFVEAASLLRNLADLEIINITPTQLEAFAGLTFKRKYHYFHFAPTYIDGLSSDYSKLFLSFLKYNPEGIFNLADNEVMKRSDQFTFNAGGKVEAPLGNGLELRAGVLVSYAFNNTIMVQKLPLKERQNDEVLSLSMEKDFNTKASAELSLQYDFFNILKLTLLSSELEYSYGKSKKTYLTFIEQDREDIKYNPKSRAQLSSHIGGNHELNYWQKRVTTLEDKVKRDITSKFSFLLYGNIKKKATEQIIVVKNGIKKTFFKHFSEKKRYVQGLLSRLFSDAIRRVFDFGNKIKEKSFEQTQLYLEFEAEEKYNSQMKVSDESQFSLKLSQSFYVDKTHKWYHGLRRRRIINDLKAWSSQTESIQQKIKSRDLIGPISFTSNFTLYENGFRKLKNLEASEAISIHLRICGLDLSWQRDYSNRRTRRRVYRDYRRESEHRCAYRLINSFEKYQSHQDKILDLAALKDYLEDLLKYAESYDALKSLMGEENIFLNGNLTARNRRTGESFTHFYHSGQFDGVGVIDRFKQSEIMIPLNSEVQLFDE